VLSTPAPQAKEIPMEPTLPMALSPTAAKQRSQHVVTFCDSDESQTHLHLFKWGRKRKAQWDVSLGSLMFTHPPNKASLTRGFSVPNGWRRGRIRSPRPRSAYSTQTAHTQNVEERVLSPAK
jgi:hypothetical protein